MATGVRVTALLDVWEAGRDASPGERALALLEFAEATTSREALARWTVGRRDGALLALRERLFGAVLSALADCPRCGEVLEMEFPTSGVTPPPPAGDGETAGTDEPVFELEADGRRIRYRLPTAGDLAALGRYDGEATSWLLERCLVAVDHVDGSDGDVSPGARVVGPAARAAFEAALARTVADRDPQADVELALTCPACGAAWLAPFDITAFLWRELEAWAMRTLRETHLLATAYGWDEDAILALSPWRRRHYLDLVGGDVP